MEKHELDALIKRRFIEGKTLSIRNINDEEYTTDTIMYWATKYYGSWTEAKRELNCNDGKYEKYEELSEEEIIISLRKYANNGAYDYKSGIPSGLVNRAIAVFGGIKNARKAAGIIAPRKAAEKRRALSDEDVLATVEKSISEGLSAKDAFKKYKGLDYAIRRTYGGIKGLQDSTGLTFPRKERTNTRPSKYSDEELTQFVMSAVSKGLTGAKAKQENPRLYNACFKKWGSWNKALIANGYTPTRKTPRHDWTKDELAEIYLKEIGSGIPKQDVSNKAAIRKLFGGLTEIQKYLGIYEEETQYELLSKVSIDCFVNQALKMDVDNISMELLDSLNANLTYSIKHYYGGITEYFSIIDIDRYKKPYAPFTWTKENIVWQLERWIREGYPVNYTAIQSKHKGIIVACRKLFGSYKKAFEYAGLNYDDYRIDTAMASRQGFEFENVVAEILTDLGVEYLREPSINGCHPDFVIGDHWIDAKLSEWTVSFADCGTIHKYLPHCKKLTIIYLRKMKDDTSHTNELGIDLVHVSELLKRLPENKAQKYQRKLDAILNVLKENAS